MDIYVNNRNQNTNNGSHVKAKKSLASRQAFGELKNVMHSQPSYSKSSQAAENGQGKSSAAQMNIEKPELKASPINDFGVTATENNESSHSVGFDEAFIDSIDFSKLNCCDTSDAQIWSEMGVLDDSFINKLIEGVKRNLISDDDEIKPEANFEDLIDLYSTSLMPHLYVANSDEELVEDYRLHFAVPDLSSSDDDLPPLITNFD